jgi:hypothetical protein
MTTKQRQKSAAGIIFAAALVFAFPAGAADKTGSFGVGVGYSDNIFRDPDATESETIYTAAAEFTVFSDTGRVQTDTFSQLAYMDYKDGSFDNELVGGFLTLNTFQFVPNRFEWVLNDNFGQRASDPLIPVTPNNRENVNFFTTGPVFDFASSARNTLELELLYSRVDFEDSPFDNSRYSAAFTLGREIRRNQDLALVLSTETINFSDGSAASDFDRHEAYFRYQLFGNQTTLNIDLGGTRIDTVDDELTGFLFRLSWNRHLSTLTSMRIIAGTSYSDEGNIFRFFQDELREVDFTEEFVNSAAPFINNYINGQYTYSNGRNLARISLGWNQADFQGGVGQDREAYLVNVRLQRDFSRSFFGGLRLRYRNREFIYLDNETETRTASVNLGFRMGPRFSLEALYQYQEREDTDPAASFDESRYFLTLNYTPRWSQY